MLTKEQLETLRQIRDDGYAVIVWTPEELAGVNPGAVEDRSIEVGWDIIDTLKENQDGL